MKNRARGTILLLVICYLAALYSVYSLWSRQIEKSIRREAAVVSEAEMEMVIVDTLRAGDTLDELFRKRGFTYQELLEIVRASREHYNLNRVQAGTILSVAMGEDGTINNFVCNVNDDRVLVVNRDDEGYSASIEDIPFEVRTRTISGVIESSLYETFIEMGEDPLISASLSEVFAWQIDFNTDLRKGDNFRAIVEEKIYEGKHPVLSRIVAARMSNQGRALVGVRFEDPDGHVDYYDPDGKSVKRKFLRSPLRYTRVSSRFSTRRYHPILKIYRPHLGVDYAAPAGTPVVSVGDGVVITAGWNGGFGRYVKIRHNSIYKTSYGHLSRYARGIKKGTRVKQGQVIGYVGSSGLATGPHLDYRLTKHGRFLNPLKVDLPAAEPVKKEFMEQFRRDALTLLDRLDKEEPAMILTRDSKATSVDGG